MGVGSGVKLQIFFVFALIISPDYLVSKMGSLVSQLATVPKTVAPTRAFRGLENR